MIDVYVRDKETGAIHQVGTNIHDYLFTDETGAVQYENLQNGGGTPEMFEFMPMEMNVYGCHVLYYGGEK